MIGLETALALGITNLVRKGHLTLSQLLEKMTVMPAGLYGMECGNIKKAQMRIWSYLMSVRNGG